eukprot:CAMPEP_0197260540 /NCGR_PEP_ID=MMETSP1429-20130617/84085_1 /TAXON_ID=49237 /ORGANISM="Chaetoceros  sp., Strain UNC1202" /LENGTH=136 /DNA_ID=CAMNT_0042724783 /DNA_START=1328 /DNA_END=1738 /DNA_ORIENTATION=-
MRSDGLVMSVKRLKQDLWIELEMKTSPVLAPETNPDPTFESSTAENEEDENGNDSNKRDSVESCGSNSGKVVSFKDTVKKLSTTEEQEDASLAFYFICVLHLANEKGLKLENGEHGLQDFGISRDGDMGDFNLLSN